jgi:hypothetical protein
MRFQNAQYYRFGKGLRLASVVQPRQGSRPEQSEIDRLRFLYIYIIYKYTFNMASLLDLLPALRRTAPRLTRQYFTCCQCRNSLSKPGLRHVSKANAKSAFPRSFSSSLLRSSVASSNGLLSKLQTTSPLSSLSETIKTSQTKAIFFPDVSDKVVAYWLLGSAASVFGIVVFGGLTRLTESGYVHISDRSSNFY